MHDFPRDLDQFATDLRAAANRLQHWAENLESTLAPPGDDMIAELVACRDRFQQLVERAIRDVPSALSPGGRPPANLNELREFVRQLEQRSELEQLLRGAASKLERVELLMHRELPEFPSLIACKAQARQARQRLHAVLAGCAIEVAAKEALVGTESFAALLEIVDGGDTLSDARCDELEDWVENSFGRELRRAATRGKLGFVQPTSDDREVKSFPSLVTPEGFFAEHPKSARSAPKRATETPWESAATSDTALPPSLATLPTSAAVSNLKKEPSTSRESSSERSGLIRRTHAFSGPAAIRPLLVGLGRDVAPFHAEHSLDDPVTFEPEEHDPTSSIRPGTEPARFAQMLLPKPETSSRAHTREHDRRTLAETVATERTATTTEEAEAGPTAASPHDTVGLVVAPTSDGSMSEATTNASVESFSASREVPASPTVSSTNLLESISVPTTLKADSTWVSGSAPPQQTSLSEPPLPVLKATARPPSVRISSPGNAEPPTSSYPLHAPQTSLRSMVSDSSGSFVPAVEMPLTELASHIRRGITGDRIQALSQLIWELIRHERTGLAYHVARCVEVEHGFHASPIPSDTIRANALGRIITSSFGDAVDGLRETIRVLHKYASHLESLEVADRLAGTLVLLTISLRPALLAPDTGVTALLEQLDIPASLHGLATLRDAVLKFTHLNLELTPSILKGVREHAAWESLLRGHQEKCLKWREHGRQANLIYAPATHVWRRWLDTGGSLIAPFDNIIQDQRNRIGDVRRAMEVWSSTRYIDSMITKTDRDIRGRGAELRPIEDLARTVLQKRVKEATDLFAAWISLLEQEPRLGTDFRYKRASECRREVIACLEKAELSARFAREISGNHRLAIEVASKGVIDTIKDLRNLFDPDASPIPDRHPREVLCKELLAIPSLALDPDWNPPQSINTADFLGLLLAHIERGPVNWSRAFFDQLRTGNFDATERILGLIEQCRDAGDDVDRLRREQERAIGESRARLSASLKITRAAIERAIAEDLFAESELIDRRSIVDAVRTEEVRNFATIEQQLQDVRTDIENRRQLRVDEVRERLRNNPVALDLSLIEQALAKGNLLAANEYIAMIERGETIQDPEPERDAFREFFPATAMAIQQFLTRERNTKREVVRALGRRESMGPLNMADVAEERAEEAKRMLTAWIQASNYEGADPAGQTRNALIELLQALGFRNVQVSSVDAVASEKARTYNVQADPIVEQRTCVIPHYGSLAGGRYRILCVWKRPSEEELVDLAGSMHQHDRPLLILYFGNMSESRRRSLALLCKQRPRSFLLVDENLIFFLATEKGLRLPSLFSCTFPFTVADPYTTTAGLVPFEMFFGRRSERASVFEPTGTCLVYGGRQLGKTALLRDVERRHHTPAKGLIVRWIDLKAEGIGLNRPIGDLWVIIARILNQEKVLSRHEFKPDGLGNAVEEWLAQDAKRRIVLLLDEADAFLKSDAETRVGPSHDAFSNLWRLKGIMDKTSRRFKVVFAGLHNVQRTSRDVNSPLAHLGAPICIGPLLGSGEWREARRMVTMPFSQLGYQFDATEDLPTRILALANWYPSLIQLFCKHLLEHLTHPNRPSFSVQSCPPYVITAKHIEDAYQSQELRKAIVDRFRWTLDLDPRYRLIALVIALECATQRDGFITGFSVQWIREQALSWWEAGFRSTSSLEGLRTILDEMIGLGVLRKVAGSNYALRSPNVVNLLGTKEEIEHALIDATLHQPPPEYEASTFRRALPGNANKRSPLTAKQESDLVAPSHGVSVIFGSKLAGLLDMLQVLRDASTAHKFDLDDAWDAVKSHETFRSMLSARTERREGGLVVFVVPISCPWDIQWVIAAAEKLRSLKSTTKLVRVIFLADPKKAWSWVQQNAATRERVNALGVSEMSLTPWHENAIRRWLIDAGLGPGGGGGAERFAKATGSWGEILHEAANRCEKGLHQWEKHLDEFEASIVASRELLDRFEIREESLPALKVLADMDSELNLDGLVELLSDAEPSTLRQVLDWAELLSYATRTGVNQWRIDGMVGHLLQRCPT